jgi:tetratricopeptide (TPR) repeat protein
MYDIINELLENRLVTITGAGGIGKTMVAIEVARWFFSRSHFHHGIFYIDLRQTDTVEGLIDIIGATLGVQPAELTNIIAHLRKRSCLLLLDNAEDILWQNENVMQELIDTVLKATMNTKLLITSQRPVGGNLYEPEYVYRIYPLEQEDAAHLFLITAKRRMAKEEWESDTFYSLLEQLGGHPLSIVLTACQLTPGLDLEDLTKRINLYKARAITVRDITDRDAEHGESLVASLASAYDELCERAKTLFGVLSLLPAGAREEMLTDIFGDTAWECVHELNEASLVEIRTRRATLLPPVRLFAMSVTAEPVREEYGPRVLEVLGLYTKELYEHHSTKYAKEYRLSFTADEPNLRSAVDLPCAPPQSVHEHSALGILGPHLIYLYILHNRWKEAKEVGRRILSSLNRVKDQLGEADTLLMMGMLAVQTGDFEKARPHYERALTIYQQIDHKLGEANMFWKLGELIMLSGDFEKARSHYERALTIHQHIGRRISEAHILVHLADLIKLSGDFEKARSHYETALTIYQQIEYSLGEANTLKRLGDLAVQSGDFEKARPHYETALTIYQNIDDKTGEASAYILLGQWAALTDQVKCAESFLDSGFTLCQEIDYLDELVNAHMVKAFILLKHHHIVNAAYELDCCSSIQDKIHAYSKAVPWLILYAVHLRSHEFEKGAKLCLKYAERFASKARNQYLQNQVNQQLREVE